MKRSTYIRRAQLFFSTLILLPFFMGFPLGAKCYAQASGIELHAHPFMSEGLGWLFRGDFNGPLKSDGWKDRFSSQINPETLVQSQLDIVVATLYAHPLFTRSLKMSIRKQMESVRQFVKEHPQWILAESPIAATKALGVGKRVLILALEGASGILDTEEDFKEFIDQGGIRIVTPLHLTDDELGGVAFLKGFAAISSPWALFTSFFHPVRDPLGVRLNSNGLTAKGRDLISSLVKRKVWVDLAHSSDASQKEIIPLLLQSGQPLLYTHTVLRKYLLAERGISEEQLKKVAETEGLIGLMPSEQMLEGTPVVGDCQDGLHALNVQFQEVAKVIEESAIGIGSDLNGGIPHLKPSCDSGTPLDQEGFWHIGQSQGIWQALEKLGAFHPKTNSETHTKVFLDRWSRVFSRLE